MIPVYPNYNPNYNPNYQNNYFAQKDDGGLNWVQGEAAAKSYLVQPGRSVLLMDSEKSVFYIKSADASGMPLPLRIFDYTERTAQTPAAPAVSPNVEYVTKEEFEKRLAELAPKTARKGQKESDE